MPDTMNNFTKAGLLLNRIDYDFRVGRIRVKKGVLDIEPFYSKTLFISGQFNTRVEVKRINQLPSVQSQYVQGGRKMARWFGVALKPGNHSVMARRCSRWNLMVVIMRTMKTVNWQSPAQEMASR